MVATSPTSSRTIRRQGKANMLEIDKIAQELFDKLYDQLDDEDTAAVYDVYDRRFPED